MANGTDQKASSICSGEISNPIPLWLDCDTGHDDAFAILLSAHCPSINLLGISTVYGNAPLSNTTHNTLAILEAINRSDVPVYAGASKPFCRQPSHADDIHGQTGLDGTTCLPSPSVSARECVSAVDSMYQALMSTAPRTAYLVAVGSLTNIALLFAVHPDLASHIKGLSIMGGAIGGNFTSAPMGVVEGEGERFGNWSPWAEFNIYCDPEAAQAVFSNHALAAKTTLIPLDLTHQMLATQDVQRDLLYGFDAAGHERQVPVVRKLFHEILMFFAKTYADVFGLVQGPPLHDPLAVAACVAPGLFDDCGGERFGIEIVLDGPWRPGWHLANPAFEYLGPSIRTPFGGCSISVLEEWTWLRKRMVSKIA